VVTYYEYDQRNRLVKTYDDYDATPQSTHLNLLTQYGYDGNGNCVTVTEPDGSTTQYLYNGQNDAYKVIDAEGYVTFVDRAPTGWVDGVRRSRTVGENGPFYVRRFRYDDIGRVLLSAIDDPNDTATPGNPNNPWGANSIVTQYAYLPASGCSTCDGPTPGLSLPYRVIDPANKYLYLEYDKLNRLSRLIRKVGDTDPASDPNDAVTEFVRDPMGRVLSWTRPEGETVTFEYDGAGRRRKATAES
jgi:YD repeat-containing protein